MLKGKTAGASVGGCHSVGEFLTVLLLALMLVQHTAGHKCFLCASSGRGVDPGLRRRLGGQRDVFYWPLEARNDKCNVDQKTTTNLYTQFQICDTPLCVTLTPNVQNVTFTIRGCLEQIIRRPLQLNAKLTSVGKGSTCFLVRSKPLYASDLGQPLNYLLCVCDGTDEPCNAAEQPSFVPIGLLPPTDGDDETVVELVRHVSDEQHVATHGRTANQTGAIYESVQSTDSSSRSSHGPTAALESVLLLFASFTVLTLSAVYGSAFC